MCRLLSIFSQEAKSSSARYTIESWIEAWRKATQRDPYLTQVYMVPLDYAQHANGWGTVALGADTPFIDYSNIIHNLEPAFDYTQNTFTRSILNSPLLKNKKQMLLVHARRASSGTPLTFQQLQPFLFREADFEIYLSHNGSVSSSVMNSMLDPERQLNSDQIYNMSDSQVLFEYIKQEIAFTDYFNVMESDFWIKIAQSITQKHYSQNASFKLQLQLLLSHGEEQKHISIAALDRGSIRLLPYYRLYTMEKDNFWVCCSSTVLMYFEEAHNTDLWTINPIDNNNIIEYSFNSGEISYTF